MGEGLRLRLRKLTDRAQSTGKEGLRGVIIVIL